MVASVSSNSLSSLSSASRPAANPPGNDVIVQRGDTLSQIAAEAGVPLRALLDANPQITNPNRIFPGDRIHLPDASDVAAPAPAVNGGAHGGTGATQLSAAGVDLIKGFEGLRLAAYQDSAGVWTIGYGHTAGVQPGDRITTAEAEQLLRQDTAWAQQAVRDLVRVPLSQGQFDALTSFTFNLGAGALESSTLLRKLNAGDTAGAQAEFGRWIHADGQVLPGLVRRRAAEAALFDQTPLAPAVQPDAQPTQTAADLTVRRGDTLWDLARTHGVSLQALVAANPQLADPNLIRPGQTLQLPGGARPQAAAPVAGTTAAQGPDDAGGAADIARQFIGRNASELKRSGDLPMDPSVPSNVCCANFVSAVLQQAGLLPASAHTNSVDRLDDTLRARGWTAVDPSQARPGDVVIIQGGGVSHTVMVESNDNGRLRLIGSNNINADGTQQVSVGGAAWALRNGGVILTPPTVQ